MLLLLSRSRVGANSDPACLDRVAALGRAQRNAACARRRDHVVQRRERAYTPPELKTVMGE